eukprot:9269652-Karenia_brevis.AAC.1
MALAKVHSSKGGKGPSTIYTDGSGDPYSQDPRLRMCGSAWIVSSANAQYNYAPVFYFGEYGSLNDRQTVPRAELVAVMRA